MQNYFFALICTLLCLIACKNDPAANDKKGGPNSEMVNNPAGADVPLDTNQLARIAFEEKEFNFGEVNEGDIVEHKFKFTNTGKVPLIISNARSSCGCTIPSWPEDPIPPGGTGEIEAKFNTTAKHNEQRKGITITANTYPSETRVLLVGNVKPVKG